MGAKTEIPWCHFTFNPWWGCVRVSPGCENCYAEAWDRRYGGAHWGVGKNHPRRVFGDHHWREPEIWNRKAREAGVRRRVFCLSMGDVLEDHRQLDAQRARLFDMVDATPALDWLFLTKRPQNAPKLLPRDWFFSGAWPRNVWMGTTVENQRYADERLPHLKAIPAWIRFISLEPLLGLPIIDWRGIHWGIVGGESGTKARAFQVAWARYLVQDMRIAGVAPFVKQMGDHMLDEGPPSVGGDLVRIKLRTPKGANPEEWASDLRVREFPKLAA